MQGGIRDGKAIGKRRMAQAVDDGLLDGGGVVTIDIDRSVGTDVPLDGARTRVMVPLRYGDMDRIEMLERNMDAVEDSC